MRKLTMTLTAAALILGTMAVGANAQSQPARQAFMPRSRTPRR